jgi:hypothetical protein
VERIAIVQRIGDERMDFKRTVVIFLNEMRAVTTEMRKEIAVHK